MKFLILAALIGAVVGQDFYTCNYNDASKHCPGDDRETRTGCRLFCDLDVSRDNKLSKSDFVARFNSWNGGNNVPKADFQNTVKGVMKICDGEAETVFNVLKTLGADGPDDQVTKDDMETFFDWAYFAAGNPDEETIGQTGFGIAYDALYLLFADDTCTDGF